MKRIGILLGTIAVMGQLLTQSLHAQYAVAGTLYVDLRAGDPSASTGTWTNLGTLGHFTRYGSPAYVTNVLGTGIPGLLFNGASDYHVGPLAPSDITGANDFSIEVWTLNPVLAVEETLVAWGRRGASRRNCGANFGSDLRWGAGTFYDDDVGWNTADLVPSAGQWHHIVLTYDGGTTARAYVDGALRVTKVMASPLVTESSYAIETACQRNADGTTFSMFYSGYINSVRVHSGLLAPEQVAVNYALGPALQAGPVKIIADPSGLTVMEGVGATFGATVYGSLPISYQWYRDGAPIPGANGSAYTLPQATVLDDGARFSLWVSNMFTNASFTATSAPAVLHVLRDTNPPVLLQAQSLQTSGVQVFFSEAIKPATAMNLGNYTLTSGGEYAEILNGSLSADGKLLTLLTADPLILGATYTLTASNLQDYAYTPNVIVPGSQATFVVTPFAVADVGSPSQLGWMGAGSNYLTLRADGTDIGGVSDQFSMAWQPFTGDFDVQLRLQSLGLADVWTKAGLMAREALTPASRFAAVLATPSLAGEFFEYRSVSGAQAVTAGSFPVNYPYSWLRLKRAASQFTGYASYDGQTWTPLGSISMALSNTLYVGIAVSSHTTNQTATASFSDFGVATSTAVGTNANPSEPLGPSSRRTGLVISEIMYRPMPRLDNRVLEFIEIYNSNPFYHDISGYRVSGDIDYAFPAGTIIPGGGFIVVAASPADVQAVYGLTGAYGPYAHNLKTTGTIRLRDEQDTILLETNYRNTHPWPMGADGTGHSIVLSHASYGENDPRAWSMSAVAGGSPGSQEYFRPTSLPGVVINELLANAGNPPAEDLVELYNHSGQSNDLTGCVLTDTPATNKFVIPHLVLPPGGYAVFTQTQLGFGLKGAGDTVYLKGPDGRVLDAVRFEAQATGISLGRWPNGANDFYPLSAQTPGGANSDIRIHDLVINEVMYNPISRSDADQFIELYNQGTNTWDLFGARFVDGINFTFTNHVMLPPNGYLVVAHNTTNLLAKQTSLNPSQVVGDFTGNLSHGGERLALALPEINVTTNAQGVVSTNVLYPVIDEVTYGDGGRWGQWADGGGSSLELINPRSNHRRAANWADSDESAKAPWTTIQASGVLDNGSTYNSIAISFVQLGQLDPGECLIDDIEVLPQAGSPNYVANGDLELGLVAWELQGCFSRSSVELGGGYGGSGNALHLRTGNRLFTLANSAQVTLTNTTLASGQTATLRFKARWLKGCPEILMRLAGNYLEATGPMTVPTNLGTPGQHNSRGADNAAPALFAVTHNPPLPAAGQPVVVMACASDADAVTNVTLQYRVDPSSNYVALAMVDDGTSGDSVGGDGIFSAMIPAQANNTTVAFIVTAADAQGATSRFPALLNNNGLERECLVHWGDPAPLVAFGTYYFWFSQATINRWTSLPILSNEDMDGTLVYNNRVIYNMSARYAGSPYHQAFNSPVGANACHYNLEVPPDDKLLGHTSFNKIHWIGNDIQDDSGTSNSNDSTLQREQVANTLLRGLGQPWIYRRYIRLYVNGVQRGQLMEDALRPSVSVPDAYFPNDTDGFLYKIQPWFEGGPSMNTDKTWPWNNKSWSYYTAYTTAGGAYKKERYRWGYEPRQAPDYLNNFTNVYAIITAGTNYPSTNYYRNMTNLADMENWVRLVAANHAAGNWDCVGIQNAQNVYGYVGPQTRWTLFMFDFSIVLGNRISWGPGQNLLNITSDSWQSIYGGSGHPAFRRMYWRALKELVNGALQANVADPLMEAKYAAFRASGVNASSPQPIKDWVAQARISIASQVAAYDTPELALTPNMVVANNSTVVLSGAAPLEVVTITIGGASWPVTWQNTVNWTISLPVSAGTNTLTVLGYDRLGRLVNGASNQVTVLNPVVPESPLNNVVISEVLYRHPTVPGAEFVELYNNSATVAFDLSGWRFNGLDYTFPPGAFITPKGYLVLAKERAAYLAAFGASAPLFDVFNGNLQSDGETLSLIQPGDMASPEVTIDRVRYEANAPWPPCAGTNASSLQLVDSRQDNSRVSNWSDGSGWRYFTYTGPVSASRLAFMFPDNNNNGGDVYIDDIKLVPGTVAGEGTNYVSNGTFETTTLTPWIMSGPATNSHIEFGFAHSGSNSLHLTMKSPALAVPNWFYETTRTVVTNSTYTLSFWYYPGTNGVNLQAYVGTSFQPKTSLRASQPTPGASNNVAQTLPAYPPLWLNEVQARNVNTRSNRLGQFAPWLELYNAGTTPQDLTGYYLANNYTNQLLWAFPSNTWINPGEFKLVWLDGADSTSDELHAGFTVSESIGSVALVRLVGGLPQVVDYLNYSGLGANLSYGDYPDGQPFARQTFYHVTAEGPNDGQHPALFINEWLAQNVATTNGINGMPNPVGGGYDDWFELYNPNPYPVNLKDYYLTDTISNRTQYRIPSGYSVPANGFLLVWADGRPGRNSATNQDLHVSFQLSKEGEQLALFDSNTNQVDWITFGAQTANISQGRYGDGAPAPFYFMTPPTPRMANVVVLNTPPNITPILNQFVTLGQTLSFTVQASDNDSPVQSLTFNLADGAPANAAINPSTGLFTWTPTMEQAPGTNQVTVVVTDSGVPALSASASFTVRVLLPPRLTISSDGSTASLSFPAMVGRHYRLEFKNDLGEVNWQPVPGSENISAASESLTISLDISSGVYRFYRLSQLH